MPVAAVRRWLKDQSQDVADVEGIAIKETKEEKRDRGRSVLRWRGIGKNQIASAREIRPGDTIVVPTSYKGADEYGWNPAFAETRDIGDEANNKQAEFGARKPRYRVDVLTNVDRAKLDSLIGSFLGSEDADPDTSVAGEIAAMLPEKFKGAMKIDRDGKVITWPAQPRKETEVLAPSEETDEDDDSSFIGRKVRLQGHTNHVVQRARKYAEKCGLAPEMVEDIVLAAENHDLGKRDDRFQSLLYGRPFGENDKMLAKSGYHPNARRRNTNPQTGGVSRRRASRGWLRDCGRSGQRLGWRA